MNYLAHAYLSFDEPKVLVGNFIGDFVRGKVEEMYEAEIAIGIRLHREIDAFTDAHPEVKAAQLLLRTRHGRYASVITDMFFDYFLGRNWSEYHAKPLEVFAQESYALLESHREILPDKFLPAFDMMQRYNWLYAYSTLEGIRKAMSGMAQRTRFESNMEYAHVSLQENFDTFEQHFKAFFPELVTFVDRKLAELKALHDSL
ncbi:ACP phosphodieterase [Nitritalea halalkaliphila LW7]|uniref:ACP phosphodieterase n=1 Tax=Nitritalea halalkaliphila LW7 TaxID=1189621 RepID=I5C1H9_9BACT|nr:ACP phosphodiesterase [Nitritalea halalkaliphila]EIM75681.1 ACP phosphodieterase [Nitritalea halalkaliphila LW7]